MAGLVVNRPVHNIRNYYIIRVYARGQKNPENSIAFISAYFGDRGRETDDYDTRAGPRKAVHCFAN